MTQPVSSHPTSVDLLVLHTLRCIGFSSLPGVARATGLPESDVESELIDLGVAGLVTHTAGDFGGWNLTEDGRASDAERIAAEVTAAGARVRLTAAFDRFLVLNPELLDLCTAWQTRTLGGAMTMNDHSDPSYDARVLDRFMEFHQRAEPLCAELSATLLRFQRYPVRLADALARAKAGSLEYIADSTSSYHTVWFQLHEDLLATLGIPRH
ncbi:transcriptional regulator [Streptomyces albipurpureus]|uniref:Transcriptional regulator n=1 Tax=Streptomyces albipurpureus TaxID=2897419 RepID=A0ABT0UM70_9ACTN|nr:transcriptional regulator [Streptomyces sp. CWNU-1]MCM2388361.1 transcriptional regulator [Streptomyces sp. CWNU-1]